MRGVGVQSHQIDLIAKFIGYDYSGRPKNRGIRTSASPDFSVLIREGDDDYTEHQACIVVSNVPIKGDAPLSVPVAIGMVIIDGEEWYLLIRRGEGQNVELYPSEVLVRYDGEPEELLTKTHLFDVE